MRVFVTKYALTQGILEYSGEVSERAPSMVVVGGTSCRLYFHGAEWHRTREEAVAQAESMREAKIRSLEKSIKKLKALDFGASG